MDRDGRSQQTYESDNVETLCWTLYFFLTQKENNTFHLLLKNMFHSIINKTFQIKIDRRKKLNQAYQWCIFYLMKVSYLWLLHSCSTCSRKYSGFYLWIMRKYELMLPSLWCHYLWKLSIKSWFRIWNKYLYQVSKMLINK